MANYCENVLTVTGEYRVIKDFVEVVQQNHDVEPNTNLALNFSIFVPVTNEMSYDAVRQAWGTTRCVGAEDAGEWEIIEDGDNSRATLDFWTASTPPIVWLLETARRLPGLHFYMTYEEPANRFGGIVNVQGSQVFENSEYDLDDLDFGLDNE